MPLPELPIEVLEEIIGAAILSHHNPTERKSAILDYKLVSKDWRAAVELHDEIFVETWDDIVPVRRLVNRRNEYITSRKSFYFGVKGYDHTTSSAVKASITAIFSGLCHTLRRITLEAPCDNLLGPLVRAKMPNLVSIEINDNSIFFGGFVNYIPISYLLNFGNTNLPRLHWLTFRVDPSEVAESSIPALKVELEKTLAEGFTTVPNCVIRLDKPSKDAVKETEEVRETREVLTTFESRWAHFNIREM